MGPFVPARLAEARVGRGLSATGLASLLSVTPQAVSNWEAGKHAPRAEVLAAIAARLELPERFFRSPRVLDQSPIFWRSFAYATKSSRAESEQRFRWLQDIVRYLHAFLEFPPIHLPVFNVPASIEQLDNRRIEQMALEARDFWGLGDGPVSDVVLLMENAGVVTGRLSMGHSALDAFSQWSQLDGLPYVVLGDSKTAARSRLDAAHELAHLLLHRGVMSKSLLTPPMHKLIENQAFRFAGALLLPASSFLAEVWQPTLEVFRSLKERWKVSIGAMIHRCHELGFIDDTQYKRLWMNYYQRGYREKDMHDDGLAHERPRLVRRCFETLLSENVQTKAEILNSLPFRQQEIESLAGLPTGFLTIEESTVMVRAKPAVVPFPRRIDG